MVEIEKEYLRVWIDRSIKLMFSEWFHPVNSEEYRVGNQLLLDLLNEYKVVNWIADSALLGEISVEDEQWTFTYLIPAMTDSALEKVARVSGADKVSFSKFEKFAQQAEESYIGKIVVRQFETYKEAADWIADIPA
ncbi:hypothetical protein [Pontibacter sp. H249]|uniref:hypothetical protein n=1 Tax=Pontibacter sp. H249 TaxID=3133420 RepID=UPI0030C42422